MVPDAKVDGRTGKRERLYQSIGVVTWASFLAASIETMTFFAFFDPASLGIHDIPPEWVANRMAGYTFGFFIFWAFTLCAAALTAYLLPRPPLPDTTSAGRDGRP